MGKNNTKDTVKTAKKQQVGVPFTKDDPRINRKGRPRGSGISITTEIKKKLEQAPEGQRVTYLELLINRIMKQAIQYGDQKMIKQIWNYVDGMPKQAHEISGKNGGPIEFSNLTDEQLNTFISSKIGEGGAGKASTGEGEKTKS